MAWVTRAWRHKRTTAEEKKVESPGIRRSSKKRKSAQNQMKSEKVFNQLILAHLCLLFQALLNLISDSVNFQFFAKNRPKLLKQRLQGNEGSGNVRQFYTLSHYDVITRALKACWNLKWMTLIGWRDNVTCWSHDNLHWDPLFIGHMVMILW